MYADKAYYLAKSNQDEVGMAKASFNKGIIYSNFYLYKESIIYYNLAYNYLIKTDQDELKTSVLVDLGIVYSMNNNLEKSSEKLNLALKIYITGSEFCILMEKYIQVQLIIQKLRSFYLMP
jgi:tetratricopeptide (TPR) repeat protein